MSKRNKKKNPRQYNSAPIEPDCAIESLIDLLLALDGWDGDAPVGIGPFPSSRPN
jgi:hypothetical protein